MVASLVAEHRLWAVVVAPRLRYSAAHRVFVDNGSNLGLLHWQVNSLPLTRQGGPRAYLYK